MKYVEAESNEFLSYVIVPIASTLSKLFEAIDQHEERESGKEKRIVDEAIDRHLV